jgi:hypothetical protein
MESYGRFFRINIAVVEQLTENLDSQSDFNDE